MRTRTRLDGHHLFSKELHVTEEPDPAQVAAATMIQRLWRGRRNKAKDEFMTSQIRWQDAVTQARLQVDRDAAFDGRNSPLDRWRRVVFMVGRLREQNEILKDTTGMDIPDAEVKQLETQHWLELIDAKHRYGSNLKYYHKRWQEDDTKDNFFRWLDQGSGKNLSLSECPRERLEQERIIYLSTEQRLNYLVKIDEDGKLLWAKNNQPVDTTAGHWKDAGDGQGIVPLSMPDAFPRFRRVRVVSRSSSSSSSMQAHEATHYAGGKKGRFGWTRALRRIFTPKGVVERLLRKTVKKNTWIYVSDQHFNIFVGIKETGAFQHSSFTAGGIVTSAGLITVKQGQIHTLSPLSGHYRTSIDHFHKFVEVLEQRGVDISKVRISKAEAALWGVEHIAKMKKKQTKIIGAGKEKAKSLLPTMKDSRQRETKESRKS